MAKNKGTTEKAIPKSNKLMYDSIVEVLKIRSLYDMNILTENEINIKSLEKNFYDYGCKLAAEAFANTKKY